MKKKLLATLLVVLFLYHQLAFAAKGDQGVDLSFGMGIKQHLVMHDKFSISQIGGQTTMGL